MMSRRPAYGRRRAHEFANPAHHQPKPRVDDQSYKSGSPDHWPAGGPSIKQPPGNRQIGSAMISNAPTAPIGIIANRDAGSSANPTASSLSDLGSRCA